MINTLTLTIGTDLRAKLIGIIRGYEGECIHVGEAGNVRQMQAAADYYVRSFENVKIVIKYL